MLKESGILQWITLEREIDGGMLYGQMYMAHMTITPIFWTSSDCWHTQSTTLVFVCYSINIYLC